MISYGPGLRRKSFAKIEPILPKPALAREPTANGRTLYKQLRAPSEELRDFHKKQLLTNGNLSTEKSTSHINSEEMTTMKHSRYDEDHHNTDSIAQLFEAKNESHLQSYRTKRSQSIVNSEVPPISLSEQKMSLESESQPQPEGAREEGEEEAEDREGENYDDYVLGDRVEDEQEEEKVDKTVKKYSIDHSLKVNNRYACASESQLRMERQLLLNERRKLNQINEDREIAAIMLQYQNNKKQVLAQSTRKHQTARLLANMNHQPTNKIEKSTSLPLLKPKKEMVIPEEYNEERPAEPWKNTKNLLAKSLQRRSGNEYSKLKTTLSYGKLGFGRKKTRTICEQEIFQEQMTSLEEIKEKLRAKGIRFDASKLKKGLINLKNQPYSYEPHRIDCPQKRLPSNPIYKKFPL